MPTTQCMPDGALKSETTHRYAVAIRWIGETADSNLYRHETDGAALARLTALLVGNPHAHVDEERVIGIDNPISILYRIHLAKPHPRGNMTA